MREAIMEMMISVALAMLAACGEAGAARSSMELHQVGAGSDAGMKLGDIAEGRFSPRVAERPAAIEKISNRPNCGLPRPSPGAKVIRSYSYGGGRWSPFYTATELNGVLVPGSNARPARILITETEQPVYLFLTTYDPRLWIIDLAPGARLDGVSVLGYEHQAVVADIDPRRVGFVTMRGGSGSCWISAKARRVPRGAPYSNETHEARKADAVMDRWMLPRIGMPDEEIFPGSLAALLVGPAPGEEPMTLSTLGGKTVYVSQDMEMFWGSIGDVRAQLKTYREHRASAY